MDDFQRALEQNRRHAVHLRLDGNGEPTLHPQIFDMVRLAKSLGFSVSMSSNLSTDRCSDVTEFLTSGLDRLVVPIDGSHQESYSRYRVGASLQLVEARLEALRDARRTTPSSALKLEVQFLDWGYNHEEIPAVRARARQIGADRFEVIAPDWPVTHARARPVPRRCLWLWCVLTVDWELNYRSCTNAWSMPWPRMNMKDVPSDRFWNHPLMTEARRYNVAKRAETIHLDPGCNCNQCSDMLVVNRPPEYVCK